MSHLPGTTVWSLTPPEGMRFVNEQGSSVCMMFPAGREAEVLRILRDWCDDVEAGRDPRARGRVTPDQEEARRANNAKLGLSDPGMAPIPKEPRLTPETPVLENMPLFQAIRDPAVVYSAAKPSPDPTPDPVGDAIRASKT